MTNKVRPSPSSSEHHQVPHWLDPIRVNVPEGITLRRQATFLVVAENRTAILEAIQDVGTNPLFEIKSQFKQSAVHPGNKIEQHVPRHNVYFLEPDSRWINSDMADVFFGDGETILMVEHPFDKLDQDIDVLISGARESLDGLISLNHHRYQSDKLDEVRIDKKGQELKTVVVVDRHKLTEKMLENLSILTVMFLRDNKAFLNEKKIDNQAQDEFKNRLIERLNQNSLCLKIGENEHILSAIDGLIVQMVSKFQSEEWGGLESGYKLRDFKKDIKEILADLMNDEVVNEFQEAFSLLNGNRSKADLVELFYLPDHLVDALGVNGDDDADDIANLLSDSKPEQINIVVDDNVSCYHLEKPYAPDLTSNLKGLMTFLSDVDGTLIQGFAMQEMAQIFLPDIMPILHDFKKGVTDRNKESNIAGLNELQAVVSQIRAFKEGELKSVSYEHLLSEMNRTYAKAIAGLPVVELCRYATHFSTHHFKEHAFEGAEPLMRLLSYLGVTPSLVTGMPAEMIGGYKKIMGISEIGHPLQMKVKPESGILIYTNNIESAGGTTVAKKQVVDRAKENGHVIVGAAGDTNSDHPLFQGATGKLSNVRGTATLITDTGTKEGMSLLLGIVAGMSDEYSKGNLNTQDPQKLKGYTMAFDIVLKLYVDASKALDLKQDPLYQSEIHPGYEVINDRFERIKNDMRAQRFLERYFTNPLSLFASQ